MPLWIALFRGLNVGGRHVVPMKELRRELEDLGCESVRTYIQSGNAVFRSRRRSPSALTRAIEERISARFGFRPRVLVLSVDELRRAIAENPFPEAEPEPKTLHLSFLADTPVTGDLSALESLCNERERLHLAGTVLYLHAPDGIGRSRVASAIERLLGVEATARNWRTVREIERLAAALD